MPIYEFSCNQCGKRSETLCRLGDYTPVPCPHCGSEDTVKVYSATAVITHHSPGCEERGCSMYPSCPGKSQAGGCCCDD